MTHHTKSLSSKVLTALMASVISIGFVTGAAAAKLVMDANTAVGAGASPSAGVGAGAGIGAGVNTDTPAAGQAAGAPDSHMSTSGSAHTKSQWGSGASRPTESSTDHSKMHGHTHSNAHMNSKSKE